MRRVMAILTTVAVCGLPFVAFAKQKGVPPAMMKQLLKEKVGLSDKQIGQIQDIQYKADREKIDIHHEIQKARLDLEQLMQADQPAKGKVFSQIEKIGSFETKLKKNRVGLMLDIRKLVTPEQWQKMEMLHAKRKMKRRERRRHKRMGAPDAPQPPGGGMGPGDGLGPDFQPPDAPEFP